MYKFCFYVPASHLEQVKQTVFNAGAGKIGNYDACCWQTKGQGQFRPLPESQPYLGEHEEITIVEEYKVEMVCEAKVIHAVLAAFRQAHPYETPAFDVFKLETFE